MADLTPPPVAADMPFTALILEGERQDMAANPNAPQPERLEHFQFIMDQEAAVTRDFASGRISQADYDSFKEFSAGQVEEYKANLMPEVEALVTDFKDSAVTFRDEVIGEVEQIKDLSREHGVEINQLGDMAKAGTLDAADIPLSLGADMAEFVVEVGGRGVEFQGEVNEIVGEHVPEIIHVAADSGQGAAQQYLDARAAMSGVDQAEISAAREQLNQLDEGLDGRLEVIDARIETAVESQRVQLDHARDDLDQAQEFVDGAQDYSDAHPDATMQDYVEETRGSVPLEDNVQEEMPVAEA